MRDLIAEFKELRLQGMASAWEEFASAAFMKTPDNL